MTFWRVSGRRVSALTAFAVASPGLSQPPSTVSTIPSLAVAEKDLADERKYFILHKLGVTVEQAEGDLRFCWQFLPRGAQRSAPDFIAWRGSNVPRKQDPDFNLAYGIGGIAGVATSAILLSIVDGPLDRSMRQSRIFRCMVPRGYDRYRTSEALWKRMNEGDPEQAIRMQAQIAAGPVPPTPKVIR